MMSKTTALTSVGAVLVAVLTACSAGVSKDASYSTAAALRDAMVSSGYACPNWNDDNTGGTFDAGKCLTDNRDQLRVYPEAAAREQDTEGAILGAQLSMAGRRVEGAVLVGPNWIIYGPKEDVTRLKDKLGGYLPDISEVRMPR